MPGLQQRQHEDTSSDDDSVCDMRPTKTSTSMQWKVPIDDSDGEKFTCQRVCEQRAKPLLNRRKKAVIKKERIKNTPFVEDADNPFILFIDPITSNEIVCDKDQFFPTNPHPFRTGTIIEDEADATGQIFSDTPAINGGEKSAHLFVGKMSNLMDAFKSKDRSSAEFLKCLQDRVRYRVCPTGLEADNAPMYRGWKNSVYHRDVILPLWQCESKYQHQNYFENRWQTVKRYTNHVMDRSGCPPYIWFVALSYFIFCLNHCVDPNLADGTKSPLRVATFLMTDISPLLYFYFWQLVYFLEDES
jgi:hypothetical protein